MSAKRPVLFCLVLLLVALVSADLFAQPGEPDPDGVLIGRWVGSCDGGGALLPTEIRLERDADGNWSSVFSQPMGNIPQAIAEEVNVEGQTIEIVYPLGRVSMAARAELTDDGTLVGELELVGIARPPLPFELEPFPMPTDLDGHRVYRGKVIQGPVELACALAIGQLEAGDWIGTLDIPGQGLHELTLEDVVVEESGITFGIRLNRQVVQQFDGGLDGTTLAGPLTMHGQEIAVLEMELGSGATVEFNRPQTPTGPFPYRVEEIDYPGLPEQGDFTLSGTLTIPDGEGPFPCAVLINGSGFHDRDCHVMGHRPFLVIADHFARCGVAVLRYDERSVGRSETPADPNEATSRDLADDALAGVRRLQDHPLIDTSRIGVIGHSEGGSIAATVAAKAPDEIAFVVSLAGAGVPGRDISLAQLELLMLQGGMPPDVVAALVEMKAAIYEAAFDEGLGGDELAVAVLEAMRAVEAEFPGTIAPADELPAVAAQEAEGLANRWARTFLGDDPADVWSQVGCPVLAFNGTLDLQVPWRMNLCAIFGAVVEGGNVDVTIRAWPQLNHAFQHATTGGVDEYEEIEETFAVEVMDAMIDWLHERLGD